MSSPNIMEIIRIIWPLIILQVVLAIFAVVDITKKKKTRNLNPPIWIIIAVFLEILGPSAYFLFGRTED